MIDNLTEAISHAREKAKELKDKVTQEINAIGYTKYTKEDCIECASEHEQLASWLEELAERREADRWIPVSERLPEDETRVLTCNAEGDMLVCCGSRSTEIEGRFIWYTNGWRYGEVIAWKPLPEPYESEDK